MIKFKNNQPIILYISAFLNFLIFFLLILEISLRNFFSNNLFWIEEAIVLLFIWSIYLGAAGLIKTNDHIYILINKKNFEILKKILNLIFFILIIYFSLVYSFNSIKVSLTSINISMLYMVICLPLSFIIMLFYSLKK